MTLIDQGPDGPYQYEAHIDIPNSYLKLYKRYYSNGNIEAKSFQHNNSTYTSIGLRYEFDIYGNLIEILDCQKGYTFTWTDVINFCHAEGIALWKWGEKKVHGVYCASIEMKIDETGCYWVIRYGFEDMTVITLDGKTGKILKRAQQRMKF